MFVGGGGGGGSVDIYYGCVVTVDLLAVGVGVFTGFGEILTKYLGAAGIYGMFGTDIFQQRSLLSQFSHSY